MNKPELYKAVIRFPAFYAQKPDGCSAAIWDDMLRDKNIELAHPYFEKAMSWLEEQGRQHDYVNCYVNADGGDGQLMMVFSDRDTALLLKLAFS